MKFKTAYLYLLFPCLFLVVWLVTVYFPFSSKIEGGKKKLKELKDERAKIERETEVIIKLTSQRKDMEGMLKEVKAKIPEFGQTPFLIREIAQEAKKRGLVVESITGLFNSLKSLEGKVLIYPSFEITVKGRFLDVGIFLENLEKNPAIKGVVKGKISVDEKDSKYVRAQMVLEIKALKGEI
ncbi:MAG: type 4a pilus biogenesis protein PilO [Desulfobacterota bacterium]|nr:type 4a pilus biogenesis protein PilO [Thermodesulfobacteriota bacterium]MDW8001578.1 type 4a pilus biogenesis protein PilO [Deltaproteobacteria bacterium]